MCPALLKEEKFPDEDLGPNWMVVLSFLSLSPFSPQLASLPSTWLNELHLGPSLAPHSAFWPPTYAHLLMYPTPTPGRPREPASTAQAAPALVDQVGPSPGSRAILPAHWQSLLGPAVLTRGSGPRAHAQHSLFPHCPPPPPPRAAAQSPFLLLPCSQVPATCCPHLPPASLFPLSPSLPLPPPLPRSAAGLEQEVMKMSFVPRRL